MNATPAPRAQRLLLSALATGPNLITLSRLGLLGFALVAFGCGAVGAALLMGALAGATDYLDGWLARKTGQVTRLGEILDQFCDVVLEVVLLVFAVSLGLLPVLVLIPHVLREVWVQCLRRSSIELGENIPSAFVGKLKAAFVGWSCLPLFAGGLGAGGAAAPVLLRIGQAGIAVGIALTVASAIAYTRAWIRIYERAGRA